MDNQDKNTHTELRKVGPRMVAENFPADNSNFPSAVNTLRPQIDKIFSEVQKNLPTIDFDLSDVSSDGEESIFFHHSLKFGEMSFGFDDDKDLDTSLSQGDGPQLPGVLPSQTNTENKNKSEKDMVADDDDDDLATLLSKIKSPSEDEIKNLQLLVDKTKDDEKELELREEADLLRSLNLGHISKMPSVSDTALHQPSRSKYTSTANVLEGQESKIDEEVQFRKKSVSEDNKHTFDVDTKNISSEKDTTNKHTEDTKFLDETVYKFKERLQDGVKMFDPAKQWTMSTKQTQNKDEQIMSKFSLHEPTTLSFKIFEDIDLDSLLNAENEEGINLNSFQVPKQPITKQVSKSHNGGGDKEAFTDISEELTLIQKLAQLSAVQSGGDQYSISSIDPHTGAPRAVIDPHTRAEMTVSTISAYQENADTACQTPDTTTASVGTNTATGIGKATIRYGRLKHEKRGSEPPTVFIDLRDFERKKEDERQGLKSVQRVLRIVPDQHKEESSSDEDEMVERCNWRLTRQKIKQDLSAYRAAATMPEDERQKKSKSDTTFKKPPRVINLQEHDKHRGTSSGTKRLAAGETEGPKIEKEDDKARREVQDIEREKERQREEARKLREEKEKERDEKEKERERRLKMSQLIKAGRSLATTQGRQSAGETTPEVFDLEVSYEQAPTTLPSILSSERETLLLTVHLASNGEIVQHRNRSNRSVDTEDGLSATYIALLSWFLSLVPHEFSFLGSPASANDPALTQGPTFHVVGLQQMWLEEELRLFVVVTPSESFYSETARHSWHRKGKKDEMKGSSKFALHIARFLSVNTLNTVCPWLSTLVPVEIKSEWPEDKNASQFSYSPPLPKISTKPLSTFVQVNTDVLAARKIFNIPIGFYWQTVDTDESWCDAEDHDDDVCYETQNTMSLIYKKIFQDPVSLMAILSRICQEGLDLAGVRLLYPCPELLKTYNTEIHPSSDLDILNNVGPLLALAIRGTFARTVWMDSVGPCDPELARRTDPNSLCALYGGESRDNLLLFCPKSISSVQTELIRWFGGRITNGAMSVDVGLPYLKKEELKWKRLKKSNTFDPKHNSLPTQRPPATLTATCRADIFLLVSPLVPTSYFGVLMAASQRRGYQIRGIKRLRLTQKMAGSLGIVAALQPVFCPGLRQAEICKDKPVEAIAPCTVFLLRKENAAHNTPSLIEAFMVQLTMAGLLGCVQMRVKEDLTSKHLFHTAMYTDGLLAALGGSLSKVPDLDLSHLQLSSSISESVKKDLEQIAVVILLGHDILKKCGVLVGKLLNVLPYSRTPVQPVMNERFELLGLKWTPALTMNQAKELTPYEVGDKMWKQSVYMLMSEPALVLVLRGMNIFNILEPVVAQQHQQASISPGQAHRGSLMPSKERRIECVMSHNPSDSDVYARLFFYPSELFPDPLSRCLLPYLPESVLYFNVMEEVENSHTSRTLSLKPLEELDLSLENIMEEMVAGQQPITTLMLIKPRAAQKYLQRILKKVVQEQFVIVGLRLLMLPSDVAATFIPLSHRKDNANFQRHIEALTSGPAMALALQSQNVVKRLCDLVGPEDPVTASHQFLWRREFGSDIFNNGLYCSVTYPDAVHDLKLLFPDGLCCNESDLLAMKEISALYDDSVIDVNASLMRNVTLTCQSNKSDQQHKEVTVEDARNLLLQTICLVLTPPVMKINSRSKDVSGIDFLLALLNNGFELVGARLTWLTQKQAECLLCFVGGGSFEQVAMLCSGPCLVLAMQRDNAVLAFDQILNQHSESLRLMKEHGHLLIRPTTDRQSQALLKFFFDSLAPGSHLTITNRSRESSDETENEKQIPGSRHP